jgi:hypothetical protein
MLVRCTPPHIEDECGNVKNWRMETDKYFMEYFCTDEFFSDLVYFKVVSKKQFTKGRISGIFLIRNPYWLNSRFISKLLTSKMDKEIETLDAGVVVKESE